MSKLYVVLFGFGTMVLVATVGAACDDQGRYRLTWSFDGKPLASARDCSRRGVDMIRITAYDQSGQKKGAQVVRCFPAERRGPELDPGTYDIQVEAIRFDGRTFLDPETDQQLVMAWVRGVEVEEGEVTDISVDLVSAPACMDGVDNDADGLADFSDPGCWVTDASGIPLVDSLGRHTYDPADEDESDSWESRQ